MFILLILFFMLYVISFVCLFYKIKLQDDEIESLYDRVYSHIQSDFLKEGDDF